MATVGKLIRVANPRRKRIKVKRRRTTGRKRAFRNRLGRFVKRSKARKNPRRVKTRHATNKRHYKRRSTKRKRSSTGIVSMLKTELRRLGVSSNPRRRSKGRKKRSYRRVRRTSNPVLIELGAVNPRRKRSHMAKRRKKYRRRRNPSRVARRRRNAPPAWAKAIGYRRRRTNRRRRRHNPTNRRRRHYSRRRNPAVFGHSGGKDLILMSGGVLVGVALTKYLPTLIPATIMSNVSSFGSASFMSVLVTGAGAFAAGFLARKVMPGPFSDAVLLGGLAQTASAALNAFAPPTLAGRLALSGVGDIIPGSYVVPQNPIKAAVIPMPSAGMGAFRGAFGGRR